LPELKSWNKAAATGAIQRQGSNLEIPKQAKQAGSLVRDKEAE